MSESKNNKTWSGRFSKPLATSVLQYTASLPFDRRLAGHDVRASLAHARMLARQNIISAADGLAISEGLKKIAAEIHSEQFLWRAESEDVHMAIEQRLIALVGDAGKRLHTGRSRNDQVATTLRLWLRDNVDELDNHFRQWRNALLDQATTHYATAMPGFTHLQIAQPVSFGHHLMAYVEMLGRDHERLLDARKRINRLPLGAAALAGTSFAIDRDSVAKELGFDGLCANSLDAVSDRDFAIEFCAVAALTMVHVSRFAEELVFWMSPSIAFIDLDDVFCTGSSIMPQKKNPDVPELARGKCARTIGNLMSLLTLMKAQPLAYNKDNQEDKEPLFDTVDTLSTTIKILAELTKAITVRADKMASALKIGHATATDLADYLVRKGLPFRDAHEAVACAVRTAEEKGVALTELSLAELNSFSSLIAEDVYSVMSIKGSMDSRNHIGGTAPDQVRTAILAARLAW